MIEGTKTRTVIRKFKYGMVGGGMGSLIGDVHKRSIDLDGSAELVAGSFSRKFETSLKTGKMYGLDKARIYETYGEMAKAEAAREDGIDFVVIVTPNKSHYPISKAFLENGIHVVCDKPLGLSSDEGRDLKRIVQEKGLLFCVTHIYTGYPMVKQAKLMIENGDIGAIRSVRGQYIQGWMATTVEKMGNRQAVWRCDPKETGVANCMGDIGTHIQQMLAYVTGLKIESLSANMTAYHGRELDNDGQVLIKYAGGASGMLWASHIVIGLDNDLSFIICGEKGTLQWHQERPNELIVNILDKPTQVLSRGNGYFYPEVNADTRLPSGHVEGHFVAFANIYRG
ncbi:MAG: Gfo/Idh/MocA family oxidoreductase, partial [Eubacteriales bacterium]